MAEGYSRDSSNGWRQDATLFTADSGGEGTDDGGGDSDDRGDARSHRLMQQIRDLVGGVVLGIDDDEHYSESSSSLGGAGYGAVISQSFAGIA